jgi:hypothetical protein
MIKKDSLQQVIRKPSRIIYAAGYAHLAGQNNKERLLATGHVT